MSFVDRIVVDTDIWIGAALWPASVPAQSIVVAPVRYQVLLFSLIPILQMAMVP